MKILNYIQYFENNKNIINNDYINNQIKNIDTIKGKFLSPSEVIEIENKIKSNEITKSSELFDKSKFDIRNNLFNKDNPLMTKVVNNVELKVGHGFIEDKKRTYFLYADDKLVGKFYSEDEIKQVIKLLEHFLIKNIDESRYYSAYDIDDEILPIDILNNIKDYFNIKRWKRLGSGKFGTAFKISNTKVLKISKDIKEYEYAKKLIGLKNEHIADIYDVKYINYDNDIYVIIIKEYCKMDESYIDNLIDKFLYYTGNEMSLSYLSSEFLYGTEDKSSFDSFFKTFKNNRGSLDGFYEDFYNMIMELKKHKIYVKDFNGANIGIKKNGNLGIIELGLGYYDDIKLNKNDIIIL